jgi:hypothetical protein
VPKEIVAKVLSPSKYTALAVASDQSQVVAWGDGLASFNLVTQKLLNMQASHLSTHMQIALSVRVAKDQGLIYILTD